MKSFFIALFLSAMSVPALSAPLSPALAQYMEQLDCTTTNSVEQLSLGVPRSLAVERSVAACVLPSFVPNQGGLASTNTPPTRAERLSTITSSVSLRLDLCERASRKGDACLKLFQRSQ